MPERGTQLVGECDAARPGSGRPGADDNQRVGRNQCHHINERGSQPTCDAVPVTALPTALLTISPSLGPPRVATSSRGPGWSVRTIRAGRDVDDEVTCGNTRTVFECACEVGSRRIRCCAATIEDHTEPAVGSVRVNRGPGIAGSRCGLFGVHTVAIHRHFTDEPCSGDCPVKTGSAPEAGAGDSVMPSVRR